MSYYVDRNSKGHTLNTLYKAKQLVEDGGTEVEPAFQENLICVISNAHFDAAAYCHNEEEFKRFNMSDGRIKTWVVHPNAKELCDYKD